MRRVVLDASALLTWFADRRAAATLRAEYEQGLLSVVAPGRLMADVLAVIARTSDWPADRLARVAAEVDRLGFEVRDPPIDELASWLAQGLTTRQATYAALASSLDLPLVTDDSELRRRARTVARSPSDA
jgi:predicted nucleic acid-binding protein